MDKFIKYSKSIFNYFFIAVIVIALAVNVSVASINITNSFFSENELIRAGKFLDSVKSKVNKDGYIFYKTNDYGILVMTKEWLEKHLNQDKNHDQTNTARDRDGRSS